MLQHAYDLGADMAKEAFFKQLATGAFNAVKGFPKSNTAKGLKWLGGMGGPTSEWVGGTLGGGLLGSALADEGDRASGFFRGMGGGLAGTAGWKMGKGLAGAGVGAAGKAMAASTPGKAILSAADKVGRKGGWAHNTLGKTFDTVGNSSQSVGRLALNTAVPGALGMAGGFLGAGALLSPGEQAGGALGEQLGAQTRPRSYFSPTGF
jgi:hypothetical protein